MAYFIETCNRHGTPLLFVQDVSGFMVGLEAERSGIIRAGARFVEAMATATVPKLVLTVNHASGAGYYAMAGQGFDPDFMFTLPTGRMGVMEGESAIWALFGPELDRLRAAGQEPDAELKTRIDAVRADYEEQLDALHAAARGHVDAVIEPERLRDRLGFALWTALHNPGRTSVPLRSRRARCSGSSTDVPQGSEPPVDPPRPGPPRCDLGGRRVSLAPSPVRSAGGAVVTQRSSVGASLRRIHRD